MLGLRPSNMFPVGGIIVLHKSQRSEALTERNEGQIDPFDPPKAHLLGMVLVGLFLNGTIAEWLPAAVVFCLTSWFVISRKRAAPAQVFRLNPVSPSVLAFPIALAVVFWSLEVLALEGVALVTRGSVSRWGKLFPSPVGSSLPFSEIVSTYRAAAACHRVGSCAACDFLRPASPSRRRHGGFPSWRHSGHTNGKA